MDAPKVPHGTSGIRSELHRAQAPAVLDHSRAMPQGDGRAGPGMGEDSRAIALDMLVEPDAEVSLDQHARKRGLADLKRIMAQVVAVLPVSTAPAATSRA